MRITQSLVTKVIEYLSANDHDGIRFFFECMLKYGRLDPIILNDIGHQTIPHPVHFREGMTVRNFLRTCEECSEWSDHDFDNLWVDVVRLAVRYKLLEVCLSLDTVNYVKLSIKSSQDETNL